MHKWKEGRNWVYDADIIQSEKGGSVLKNVQRMWAFG
jgi:hypothetical protein